MSAHDNRPVFFYVGALNCGGCRQFDADKRSGWEPTFNKLSESGRVRIFSDKIPNMNTPLPKGKWPKALDKFHQFYPALLLFDGNSWNAAMGNPELDLVGNVYKGVVINGRISYNPEDPPIYTADKILDWVLQNTGGPLRPEDNRRPQQAITALGAPAVSTASSAPSTPQPSTSIGEITRQKVEVCGGNGPILSRPAYYYS